MTCHGRHKNLLCLITGPSGSGKTSIALELQKRLLTTAAAATTSASKKNTALRHRHDTEGELDHRISSSGSDEVKQDTPAVVLLHQDNYFTKPFLPYKKRIDDSYENNSGIDWDRLMVDIQFQLQDASKNDGDGDDNGAHVKIVIVEGHLLGDAAAMFRQKFHNTSTSTDDNYYCYDDDNDDDDCRSSFNMNVDILAVLIECSRETCKHRRLERRQDRSDDERKELENYIDAFVWPSFLKYGVDAMDDMRRDLVLAAAAAATTTATTTTTTGDSSSESCKQQTSILKKNNKHVAVLLEIDNSENASMNANVEDILNRIHGILA